MSNPVEPRKPLSARLRAGKSMDLSPAAVELRKQWGESAARAEKLVRSTTLAPNLTTLANEVDALKARVAELETAFKALAGRGRNTP